MDSPTGLCTEQHDESARQHRRRRGFSLVELLIALVLLEVGLLALVAMAAASTRDANASRREAAALSVAAARLERTESLACQGNNSGVSSANTGLTEWYVEAAAPNGTRVITDSVVAITTRGNRAIVLHTGARC